MSFTPADKKKKNTRDKLNILLRLGVGTSWPLKHLMGCVDQS